MSPAVRAAMPGFPTRDTANADAARRRWRALADQIDPRLATDPTWPALAAAIDRVHRAGTDPTQLLPRLTHQDGPVGPLPDDQPARALRHRLIAAHPAAATPAPPRFTIPTTTTSARPGQPYQPSRSPFRPPDRGRGFGR